MFLVGVAIMDVFRLFKIGGTLRQIITMYKKDLLWDWMFAHFFDCGWYLDYPKDTTPPKESGIKEKKNPNFLEHLAFSKN